MYAIEIAGLGINNITYEELLYSINDSITNRSKTLITYANANTVNRIYSDENLEDLLNKFSIIHPDGIGIYWASKFLVHGFKSRITGSDFYPMLIEAAIKNGWKLFFFGNDDTTLNKIQSANPGLNVSGINQGYNFTDSGVIEKINAAKPDILIIGLGFPKQEKWLVNNNNLLNCCVSICVGEGIKVFAGTKIRGPKILRILGFEWLVRFFTNPFYFFKRYIIGNPLFLYRIIILKFRKFM